MNPDPLHGKAAVVTGAGRGIGAAVAHALARAGARVVVAARTRPDVEKVAAAITAHGGQAYAVECDVTHEGSVHELGEQAHVHIGPVDVLVNAAGASSSEALRRITLAEWNRMMAVNATGTFLCVREFAPGMVERGFGRIVNLASVAGLEGAKYIAHYSAAKHAVVGLTRSVGAELEGSGVAIVALCPGYVDTPMTVATIENVRARTSMSADAALAAVLATTGQSRLLTSDEVAAAVVALCRETGAASNGHAIVLPALEAPK